MGTAHLKGSGIVAAVLLATSPAYSQGCSLASHELECGKNDAAIFSALSAGETATLLGKPENALDRFKRPVELEVFRRSIETNWKAINRVEKCERRKMRRRQISAAEFETWSKRYDTARTNYNSAMNFYRTLVWHGKTGKPAPADD